MDMLGGKKEYQYGIVQQIIELVEKYSDGIDPEQIRKLEGEYSEILNAVSDEEFRLAAELEKEYPEILNAVGDEEFKLEAELEMGVGKGKKPRWWFLG